MYITYRSSEKTETATSILRNPKEKDFVGLTGKPGGGGEHDRAWVSPGEYQLQRYCLSKPGDQPYDVQEVLRGSRGHGGDQGELGGGQKLMRDYCVSLQSTHYKQDCGQEGRQTG